VVLFVHSHTHTLPCSYASPSRGTVAAATRHCLLPRATRLPPLAALPAGRTDCRGGLVRARLPLLPHRRAARCAPALPRRATATHCYAPAAWLRGGGDGGGGGGGSRLQSAAGAEEPACREELGVTPAVAAALTIAFCCASASPPAYYYLPWRAETALCALGLRVGGYAAEDACCLRL